MKSYYRIVRDRKSGKYMAELDGEERSSFVSFSAEDMFPVDVPKSVSYLSDSDLCKRLRESYPSVESDGRIANTFVSIDFDETSLVQFYKVDLQFVH